MIKSCLNCKYCKEESHISNENWYGFNCSKKRMYFDYNLATIIRGFICMFYKQKEVKENG